MTMLRVGRPVVFFARVLFVAHLILPDFADFRSLPASVCSFAGDRVSGKKQRRMLLKEKEEEEKKNKLSN